MACTHLGQHFGSCDFLGWQRIKHLHRPWVVPVKLFKCRRRVDAFKHLNDVATWVGVLEP